jgi:hypothetical protein
VRLERVVEARVGALRRLSEGSCHDHDCGVLCGKWV